MSGSEHAEKGQIITPALSGAQSQDRLCVVCSENTSKYKCTRCDLRYCSVPCATLHMASHPPAEESSKPAPAPSPPAAVPSPGTGLAGTVGGARASGPFEKLGGSKELQMLFAQYPRLRSQLRDIYQFCLPPTEGGMGMNQYQLQQNQYGSQDNSRGGGGGGRGRGGSNRGGYSGGQHQNGKAKGPWTTDVGLQEAIDAFARAREEDGKGGEGIREYQRLVMKFVKDDGQDVQQIVQDEVAQENARLISQLLNGEQF